MLLVAMLLVTSSQVTDVPVEVEDKQVYLQAPVERQEVPEEIRREIETGCGPEAFGRSSFNRVLDVSVREACNIHDWQYSMGGTKRERKEADELMRKNMHYIVSSKRDVWYPWRLVWVDTYYFAVRSFGWMFYGHCKSKSCEELQMNKHLRDGQKKTRNQLAKWAWENKRNAAGFHKNKKREENRKACRSKVNY